MTRSGLPIVVAAVFVLGSAATGQSETTPTAIFATKCSSCHTFGHGDRVGPDLKGATTRHSRAWLTSWVRSSEKLIRAGDAAAVALFQKYRQQRMPDHDLSPTQITSLLDYLEADGPEKDARPPVRLASTATPEEIQFGQRLFYGTVSLTSGGASCSSCHTLGRQTAFGASLAPDLTKVFSKYQDKALSRHLDRTCFPRTPSIDGAQSVTEKESLALRAFLRTVEMKDSPATLGGADVAASRVDE
jgi:mono/diheme cytochrome c family protein